MSEVLMAPPLRTGCFRLDVRFKGQGGQEYAVVECPRSLAVHRMRNAAGELTRAWIEIPGVGSFQIFPKQQRPLPAWALDI